MSLLSSLMMDVFVIPVGPERYELYCEQPADDDDSDAEPAPSGFIARLKYRVASTIKAAERRQHVKAESDEPKGFIARIQERAMSWVAERVAEQRLLWSLRRETAAIASYPQDMTFDQVLTLIRRTLQRDYDRHRRWMIIDGFAFLFSFIVLGPLFLLIPGVANLPALYFGFRVVGHFLSMRGARQGLDHVAWTGRPCPPLTELREIAALEPERREARIHDVAARLRLQHLPTFFERVAVPQA